VVESKEDPIIPHIGITEEERQNMKLT
jgi:hypothetical protein